jgi:GYF domain 2
MATYTIIGGDGKQYGPITTDELRKWVSEGRLNAQSLAKAESDAEFRPLSAFPEFAEVFGIAAQMAGAPPPLGYGVAGGREAALQKIKAPAVALIVTAILNLVFGLWGLIKTAFFQPNLQALDSELQQLNNPQLEELFHKWMHMAYGPFGIAGSLLGLVLSVLILIGAMKMLSLRSYEFSMTAAIVAMLPCVTSCCFIGLPFGIWALVVMSKPEVKSHFS